MDEEQKLTHWTESYVEEGPNGAFGYYNKDLKIIGERDNKLMAQVALMDYCSSREEGYLNDAVGYLFSMQSLMACYDIRTKQIKDSI